MCRPLFSGLVAVSLLAWAIPARADLVHHWDFEEGFTDSVGGLEGVAIGNAILTDDARVGEQALSVSGGGDHVEVPDAATLQFTALDSYSVTAWVKATGGGGWRGVVTKGREAAPWYGIWINPVPVWVYGTLPNNLLGPPVELGAWVHVAIVQDGERGTRELYVNGQLEATDVARDANGFTPLFIGGAGGVQEWFVGQIDEVRIYDEGLDAEGVISSMGPPPECADGPDTHCGSFTVTDGEGNAVSAGSKHLAGVFTVNVMATDDSGDPIQYTVVADNGVDTPIEVRSDAGPILDLNLHSGSWTLTVTVDDSLRCDDAAGDAGCAGRMFEVDPRAPEGLAHYWDFEEGLTDTVGGLEGVLMGNATLTTDARVGEQALEVGGGGDHVEVPDDPSLQFTALDSYSVTAWVKPTGGAGWRGVVTKGREAAPWYGIWINPDPTWVYGTPANNLLGPPVALDSWMHVAVVQDGERGTRELYVNGQLEATNVAQDANSITPLFIGGAGGVQEWFVGQIDEVRVYHIALDAEGVAVSRDPPPDTIPPTGSFHRGDADSNGTLQLTDAVRVLNFLFLGTGAILCLDSADADDNGAIQLTDAVRILSVLFLGAGEIPAPGSPSEPCGPDGTDDALDCAEYPICE